MRRLSGSRPLVNARLHVSSYDVRFKQRSPGILKNVSDCFQRIELLGEQVRSASKIVRHVRFLIMDNFIIW